ncbi:phosphotransferase [Tenggerimyces flavus]|uniref:Phosphotransferase n=1 Tax=Tenggerimyces flavus TaxID=1708749 RepID=A0ABV7YN18_9ACTN|nr:phosphotransferase [Tenggerimyces flavus]MBM7785766.1 hypothetical protein [Tenggerimyces flavus]
MIDVQSQELPAPVVLDDATVEAFARAASGDEAATVEGWWIEPVDYVVGTPSTGALKRLKVKLAGADVPQSIFLKLLQSPKHWALIDLVPPEARTLFVTEFPWRLEQRAYVSDLGALLPEGLRLAKLYRAEELEDERVALWVEDVRQSAAPWDLRRFERAARALGRLAARRRPGQVEPFYPRPNAVLNDALRYYVDGRVTIGALPLLDDDAAWAHPLLESAWPGGPDADVRGRLQALATRIEEFFDGLEQRPHTYAHGDASPQNLLVPADAPDTFVVIDWGFDCPLAVGFDLGQLLIGLAHAGELRTDELRAVHDAIIPAYVDGLREEGWEPGEDAVRYGFVASLLLRSAFTAIPFERFGEGYSPELAAHFAERIALTKFLLDLADELPQV